MNKTSAIVAGIVGIIGAGLLTSMQAHGSASIFKPTQQNSATQSASISTGTRTTSVSRQPGVYVALGDSVAAGLGLDATRLSSTCGVTKQAYASTVAAGINKSYINGACSGATSGDLVTKQRVDGPNIDKQLDTALAGGVPDVITITAGANDVRWVDFARKCYIATCGTRFDNAAMRTLIASVRVKLAFALESIYQRSGGQPPVVVLTGYYQPISDNCATDTSSVTKAEIAWFNAQSAKLNDAIEKSANLYDFASYAPVDFTGHELCTDDPWVQDRNDPAPFHPTVEGQAAIAGAVLRQLEP